MNKTIFISGISGIVGYGIAKSIYKNKNIKIIGSSIYNNTIASKYCDFFELAPHSDSEDYFEWLNEIIKKYNVDMIIPAIEIDMYLWNNNLDKINNNCFVLLNNNKLIKLCENKWNFYEKLNQYLPKYAIPTYNHIPENLNFPMIIKPKKGFASQGIHIIKNYSDLKQYKHLLETHIIQPVIGSDCKEYTVSAFFDRNHQLLAHITLKRKLSKLGFTEEASVCSIDNLDNALNELALVFKPIGPTNFQFRLDGKQLKLLEINPRISSSTSIRNAFGYNETKMSINYFLNNKKIKQPKIKNGYAIRYTEDYIIYDSDNI